MLRRLTSQLGRVFEGQRLTVHVTSWTKRSDCAWAWVMVKPFWINLVVHLSSVCVRVCSTLRMERKRSANGYKNCIEWIQRRLLWSLALMSEKLVKSDLIRSSNLRTWCLTTGSSGTEQSGEGRFWLMHSVQYFKGTTNPLAEKTEIPRCYNKFHVSHKKQVNTWHLIGSMLRSMKPMEYIYNKSWKRFFMTNGRNVEMFLWHMTCVRFTFCPMSSMINRAVWRTSLG